MIFDSFRGTIAKFNNQNLSMIGSPKRVKIQRNLVQNLSKIQQRLKIIERFLTFWGLNTPRRSQQILGVKLTSKLNSQHHRNTQCANFGKIRQLLKNHYLRGVLNIWGG